MTSQERCSRTACCQLVTGDSRKKKKYYKTLFLFTKFCRKLSSTQVKLEPTIHIKIAMGRKKDITSKEKEDIVNLFSDGNTTLEIAKKLNRDHRTIKKEIENIGKKRTRKKTGFKNVKKRDLRKIKKLISKKRELTSKKIFEEAGVMNINREKRCRILRTLAKDMKTSKPDGENNDLSSQSWTPLDINY